MKNNTLLKNSRLGELLRSREASLLLVMVLLVAVIGWRSNGVFFSGTVISQLTQNYAYIAVLAFGMLLVLLIGGIDISIGATVALSGMSTCLLMRDQVITNPLVAYLFSILVGSVCGLIIGTVISKGKVIPIIATLGMQYILYGITHIVSDAKAVYKKDMSDVFVQFTRAEFLGINSKTWVMILVLIILYIFLTYFRTGRHMYAVGSNIEAAEMRGINSKKSILLIWICLYKI